MSRMPTDESLSIETMKSWRSTIFLFSTVLIVSAQADETQNDYSSEEVLGDVLFTTTEAFVYEITASDSRSTQSVDRENSSGNDGVTVDDAVLISEDGFLEMVTTPDTASTAEMTEDPAQEVVKNQYFELLETEQNATDRWSNTTKRHAIRHLMEKHLTLEELKAHSCEVEASRHGHGYVLSVMVHQMMCEIRLLSHLLIIAGHNLKGELHFEYPCSDCDGVSMIDLLSDGGLFDLIESSLLELEIFLGHPENVLMLVDVIKNAVPIVEIRETLSRLGFVVQDFVNHLQGLVFDIGHHGDFNDDLLKELREKILVEAGNILNMIYGNFDDTAELKADLLLKLASTIESAFDEFFLQKFSQEWLIVLKEIISSLGRIFEGCMAFNFPLSIIFEMQALVSIILTNFFSTILRIPLIMSNGNIPFIVPANSTIPFNPVPGVPCTCQRTCEGPSVYPHPSDSGAGSIDINTSNSPSINIGSQRPHYGDLLSFLSSPFETSQQSSTTVAPSGPLQGLSGLIFNPSGQSVADTLKNDQNTLHIRHGDTNVHLPLPIFNLQTLNQKPSIPANTTVSEESATPPSNSLVQNLTGSTTNSETTVSPSTSPGVDSQTPSAMIGQTSTRDYSSGSSTSQDVSTTPVTELGSSTSGTNATVPKDLTELIAQGVATTPDPGQESSTSSTNATVSNDLTDLISQNDSTTPDPEQKSPTSGRNATIPNVLADLTAQDVSATPSPGEQSSTASTNAAVSNELTDLVSQNDSTTPDPEQKSPTSGTNATNPNVLADLTAQDVSATPSPEEQSSTASTNAAVSNDLTDLTSQNVSTTPGPGLEASTSSTNATIPNTSTDSTLQNVSTTPSPELKSSTFGTNVTAPIFLANFIQPGGNAPVSPPTSVDPSRTIPQRAQELRNSPAVRYSDLLPALSVLNQKLIHHPVRNFIPFPFSNWQPNGRKPLQPSLNPPEIDPFPRDSYSSLPLTSSPYPGCESSPFLQPFNVFGKILELLLRSTISAGSSSNGDVCGRSITLPSLSHLNDMLNNVSPFQGILQIPREQISSILGNGALSPGDLVGIFIRDGLGLIGRVIDPFSPISFSACRSKVIPLCPLRGVKMWHLRSDDFRNPLCEQKWKLL